MSSCTLSFQYCCWRNRILVNVFFLSFFKEKSCGSPGIVDNGEIHYPTGVDFGDTIKVTCNPGLVMNI